VSVYPLRIENLDALNEFVDDLRRQFPDIRVLAYQREEAVDIHAAFLLVGNQSVQFRHAAFECFLLRFVVLGHIGETLIGNLAFDIVLVEPLDYLVQLVDTRLRLLQFTLAVPQTPVNLDSGLSGNHLHELLLVRLRVPGNLADARKQELLDAGIVDLMGRAYFLAFLAVGGADHVLALWKAPATHLIHLRSAVGAEHYAG
jgi:hypothetical protein